MGQSNTDTMGDIPPLGGLSVNDNAPQAATTFNDLPPDVVDAVLERYLEKIEVDELCEARLLEICQVLRTSSWRQCSDPNDSLWKAACARFGLTERLVGAPGAPATPTWRDTFLALCKEVAVLKTYHLVIRENLMNWNEARAELSDEEIERQVATYKTNFLNAYKRLLKGENPITFEEARELEHETGLRSESDEDAYDDRETYSEYRRRTYYEECLVSKDVGSDLLCFRKEVGKMIGIAGHLGLRCMLHYLLRRLQGVVDEVCMDEALQLASQNGHLAAVEMLVAAGVDVNQYSGFVLQSASDHGHAAVVEFLLAHGANVNLIGRVIGEHSHVTALTLASKNGHLAAVEALIAAGADVNIDGIHHTALADASQNGHLAVVEFLVAHGANVNTVWSPSALTLASKNGHLAVVEFLVAHGADVNDHLGAALRAASQYGHLAIVEFLVAHGADVNAKNNLQPPALSVARLYRHHAVVEFLRAHGATAPF